MKKVFVTVTDTSMLVAEIIAESKRCGADKICYGRHGIQFFDIPPGYYLPEQIEQVLQKLQGYQEAAESLLGLATTAEEVKIAKEGLSVLLQGLSCVGILETLTIEPLSKPA